jgi:hypothetical protein
MTCSKMRKQDPTAYAKKQNEMPFLCIFLCCPIMCFYVLSSVLWYLLQFPYKNDFQFVFTSSSLQDSHFIYVICVCLCIVVSNTDCVVFFVLFFFVLCTLCCFLFCFSSSCVPYVASFSWLSIFVCPFGIL